MQTLPTARYWGRRPQAAGNTLYTGVRDIDLLELQHQRRAGVAISCRGLELFASGI
jgi:hypothetical protein